MTTPPFCKEHPFSETCGQQRPAAREDAYVEELGGDRLVEDGEPPAIGLREALDFAERAFRRAGDRPDRLVVIHESTFFEAIVAPLRAALTVPDTLDVETLARATANAWRALWVESAGWGWHVQVWLDEDVIRQFENGDVADAIAAECARLRSHDR